MSQVQRPVQNSGGAIATFARRFGIDAARVMDVLRFSCFSSPKGEDAFSNEEMAAALVLANQYALNPFAKELFVFRGKGGKVNCGPTIDGWVKIATRHPEYDGEQFEEVHDEEGNLVSCTCTMHRRGRSRPTVVTEYLRECQDTSKETWRKWPHRMLRHRAMAQAVRLCFGLTSLGAEREVTAITIDSMEISTGGLTGATQEAARGRPKMVTSRAWPDAPVPQGEPVAAAAVASNGEEPAAREPGQEG